MAVTSPPAPSRDPVDIVTDASTRFAAHLEVLAHQLGESALTDTERERLAAALELTTQALARVTRAAGLIAEGEETPAPAEAAAVVTTAHHDFLAGSLLCGRPTVMYTSTGTSRQPPDGKT
jgi:hypothetical protein